MKEVSRFSALAVAIFANHAAWRHMVTMCTRRVIATAARACRTGQARQGWKHGKHHKHGGRCGHHKWDMFKGSISHQPKKQVKDIMKGHHKEFIEGRIAVIHARQNLIWQRLAQHLINRPCRKHSEMFQQRRSRWLFRVQRSSSEVMPILTPDQQAVVQGRLAKSKLRTQEVISKLQSKMESSTK